MSLQQQLLHSKAGFTPLGQCGQGSYGKVLMAVTNHNDTPLAVKIVINLLDIIFFVCQVKREDMAEIERDIISRTNKKNFTGFPTLFSVPKTSILPLEGVTHEQLLLTDLLGSSLSWFSTQKPLTTSQVYNVGIQLVILSH